MLRLLLCVVAIATQSQVVFAFETGIYRLPVLAPLKNQTFRDTAEEIAALSAIVDKCPHAEVKAKFAALLAAHRNYSQKRNWDPLTANRELLLEIRTFFQHTNEELQAITVEAMRDLYVHPRAVDSNTSEVLIANATEGAQVTNEKVRQWALVAFMAANSKVSADVGLERTAALIKAAVLDELAGIAVLSARLGRLYPQTINHIRTLANLDNIHVSSRAKMMMNKSIDIAPWNHCQTLFTFQTYELFFSEQ